MRISSQNKNKIMIYLASRSPRRREILRSLGIKFKVVMSTYVEKNQKDVSPEELVLRHALGKARDVLAPKEARYVLAADTIVYCRGQIVGKPADEKEAFAILKFIHGRMHWVYTGVVLWDRGTGVILKEVAQTKVFLKKMKESEIKSYIQAVSPCDKAGSYGIQEGPKIVKKIEGSYTNVMGLPAEAVKKMMKQIQNKSKVKS